MDKAQDPSNSECHIYHRQNPLVSISTFYCSYREKRKKTSIIVLSSWNVAVLHLTKTILLVPAIELTGLYTNSTAKFTFKGKDENISQPQVGRYMNSSPNPAHPSFACRTQRIECGNIPAWRQWGAEHCQRQCNSHCIPGARGGGNDVCWTRNKGPHAHILVLRPDIFKREETTIPSIFKLSDSHFKRTHM
jgi:hypothetical protein